MKVLLVALMLLGCSLVVLGREHAVEVVSSLDTPAPPVHQPQERTAPPSDALYLENKYAFRFSGYPHTAVPFGTTIYLDWNGKLKAKGRPVALMWNNSRFDTVKAWNEEDLERFTGPFQQGLNGDITSDLDGQEGIPLELSPLHPDAPVYTRGVRARHEANTSNGLLQKDSEMAKQHSHSHFVAITHKTVHSLKKEALVEGKAGGGVGNVAQLGEQSVNTARSSKDGNEPSTTSSDNNNSGDSSSSGKTSGEGSMANNVGKGAGDSSKQMEKNASTDVGASKASASNPETGASSDKSDISSKKEQKTTGENNGEKTQRGESGVSAKASSGKEHSTNEDAIKDSGKEKESAGTNSGGTQATGESSDKSKGKESSSKEGDASKGQEAASSVKSTSEKENHSSSDSSDKVNEGGSSTGTQAARSEKTSGDKSSSNPENKGKATSQEQNTSREMGADGKVTTTKTSTTTATSTSTSTSTVTSSADTGSSSKAKDTIGSKKSDEGGVNSPTGEKGGDGDSSPPGREDSQVSDTKKSSSPEQGGSGGLDNDKKPESDAGNGISTESDGGEDHPENAHSVQDVADSRADQRDEPNQEKVLSHSKEYVPPPSARADGKWFDAAGTGLQISTQPDTNEEPSVVVNGVVNEVLYGNGGAGYFLSRNYLLPATFYIWKFKGIPGADSPEQNRGNVTLSDSRNVTGQVENGSTALGEIDSVRITVVNITMGKNISEGCSAHDATKKAAYKNPLSSSPFELDIGFSEKCFAERKVSVRVFLGFSDYTSVTFYFTKAIAVAGDVSVTASTDTIGQTGEVVESGLSQGPWSGVTDVTATELTTSFSATSFYVYPSALAGNSSVVFENVEAVSSHPLSCPVDSVSLKHVDGSGGWNLTSPLNLTIHYSLSCSKDSVEVAPVRISVLLLTTTGNIVEWTYLKAVRKVQSAQGTPPESSSEDSSVWAHQKNSLSSAASDTSGERIAASIAALNSRIWVTTDIMKPEEKESDVFDGIVKFEYGGEPIASVGPAAATKFFFFARDNSEALNDSLDPAYSGPMVQDLKVSVIPSTASCVVSTSGDLTAPDHMLSSTEASTLIIHYHNCTVTEAVRIHVLVGFEGNKIVEFQYRKINTGAICMSTRPDITQRPDVIDHGLVRSNYGVNSTAVVSPFAKKTHFYLWEPLSNSDKTASKVKSVNVKSDILLCHPEVSGSVMNKEELSSKFQTLTITYPMLQCNVTGAVHIAVKITLENGYSFEFQYDKVSSSEAVKRIGEERERRLKSEEKHRQALRVQAAADESRIAEEKQQDEYREEKEQLRRELKILVVPLGVSLFALVCACIIWVGCDHGKRLLGFFRGGEGKRGSKDEQHSQVRKPNSGDIHHEKPGKIWKL